MSTPSCPAWRTGVLLAAAVLAVPAAAPAQDRLVLRDTRVISGRTVASLDEDGVHFDVGASVGWDEVESGRVGGRQAEFDRFLKDLGDPLYRLRRRLAAGDYQDALAHAEALFPRFAPRRSATAGLVFQGLLWARLAHGRREAAVEPYLLCLETPAAAAAPTAAPALGGRGDALAGGRPLIVDPATGLCPDLDPVWFDADAARAALPGAARVLAGGAARLPHGAAFYVASLALAAGDEAAAQKHLARVPTDPAALNGLLLVAAAQREAQAGRAGPPVQRLLDEVETLPAAVRPLAHYWCGRALAAAGGARTQEGVLLLLHLPALYGDSTAEAVRAGQYHPELAAAGLYLAARTLDAGRGDPGATFLRNELLQRYPRTCHGLRLQAETAPRGRPAPAGPGK